MKLTIGREIIVQLVAKLYSIVPAKPVLPILSNILLEAKSGELTLSATDLMVSMKVQGNAHIDEEGSATIPAKRFFSLIKELTTDRIEISYAKEEITIRSGASYFKLHSMPSTDYPIISTFYNVGSFVLLPSLLLKDALRRVSFAAARDDTLNHLKAVFLRIDKDLITLIGMDGKRLAKLTLPVNIAVPKKSDFLIPLKGIEEIEKVLEGNKEVNIVFLQNEIILRIEHITLFIKLLSEKFPDVEEIIPDPKEMTSMVLHREELMSLLRQVSLFTSEMLSSVRFIFDSNELYLFAVNAEIGEGRVSMPVNYTGERLEIAFHPTYFLDILRHCKDETIQLHLTDPFNPGLITDSTSTLFMIMPMRILSSATHVP